MILAALLGNTAGSVTMLVICYGMIGGIGLGFAYVCPIAACVKWFPDKRGLITGLAVAGFGAGAFFIAPLAAGLVAGKPYKLMGKALFNLPNIGIFNTLMYLGIAYIVIVGLGGMILRNPPPGYKPAGWNPPAPAAGAPVKTDYTTMQMLATPQFWLIWVLYLIATATGLAVIGKASPMAQDKTLAGFTADKAAMVVSVLAIFNAAGRIIWGKISDSIGRMRTLFMIYFVNCAAIFSFYLIPEMPWWMWVGACTAGFTFGGYLAIYPAVNSDFFGTKNVGINYGCIFTAYGAGALLGPYVFSSMFLKYKSYERALVAAGVLCGVAMLLVPLLKAPKAKDAAPAPAA
jgi:OFA family oxalate/formate antiporter-like MFS transporter